MAFSASTSGRRGRRTGPRPRRRAYSPRTYFSWSLYMPRLNLSQNSASSSFAASRLRTPRSRSSRQYGYRYWSMRPRSGYSRRRTWVANWHSHTDCSDPRGRGSRGWPRTFGGAQRGQVLVIAAAPARRSRAPQRTRSGGVRPLGPRSAPPPGTRSAPPGGSGPGGPLAPGPSRCGPHLTPTPLLSQPFGRGEGSSGPPSPSCGRGAVGEGQPRLQFLDDPVQPC